MLSEIKEGRKGPNPVDHPGERWIHTNVYGHGLFLVFEGGTHVRT